jgi:hypothetical protein
LRALAVFHGFGDHPLSWLLHKDFRHVFVVLESEGDWILIDGQTGLPTVKAVARADYDLAAFYRSEGLIVVEIERGRQTVRWPWALANCVGHSKAMLGIRAPFCWTPRQLFKRLTRTS